MSPQQFIPPSRNRRSLPIPLPSYPGNAAAVIAALARQDDSVNTAGAIEAMRRRVAALLDPNPHALFEELASHATTLSAMAQRWAVSALDTRNPDHAQIFNRMSVACTAAFIRTVIAIEGLRAQRKGLADVHLNDDTNDGEA